MRPATITNMADSILGCDGKNVAMHLDDRQITNELTAASNKRLERTRR